MDNDASQSVTELLDEAKRGQGQAVWEKIARLLQPELRSIARALLGGERPGHTLESMVLVDDALLVLYEKLGPGHDLPANRQKLKSLLAAAMRHDLVDHARKRSSRLRAQDKKAKVEGAEGEPTVGEDQFDEPLMITFTTDHGIYTVDVLDVDDALVWMDEHHPESRDILDRRFFLLQTVPQIAVDLEVKADVAENMVRTAIRRLGKRVKRKAQK
jgi:DNA-directed RNA polymerase specialized sigma24 family protein